MMMTVSTGKICVSSVSSWIVSFGFQMASTFYEPTLTVVPAIQHVQRIMCVNSHQLSFFTNGVGPKFNKSVPNYEAVDDDSLITTFFLFCSSFRKVASFPAGKLDANRETLNKM